jgi:toxin CcdB
MARFDVYSPAGLSILLLDCQADVLSALDTRFVVPLMPSSRKRPAFPRLNPVFTVNGGPLEMITQGAASVAVRSLGQPVASLASEQSAIMNALDMLLTGY